MDSCYSCVYSHSTTGSGICVISRMLTIVVTVSGMEGKLGFLDSCGLARIRVGLLGFAMLFAVISQLVTCVPDLNPTLVKRVLVCIPPTGAFVVLCILFSKYVGFLIPFLWHIANILSGSYLVTVIFVVFGGNPFVKNSPVSQKLRRYYRYFFSYMVLGDVFPVYKVLYDSVPAEHRIETIFVLSLWTFAGKHFMMWGTRALEAFIPGIVAFSVDFHSALFVSLCMSNSGSILTSAMIIAVDLIHTLLEFREVRTNAKSVYALLQDRRASHEFLSCKPATRYVASDTEICELFTMLISITRNLEAFRVTSLEGVRLWACLPHRLTAKQMELLQGLELSGVFRPSRKPTIRKSSCLRNGVAPSPPLQPLASHTKNTNTKPTESIEKAKAIIVQGLQLLFYCEYLALVEYVECVVPLVFVIYRSVLVHLPNIIYYPSDVTNWGTGGAVNVIVYAAMEVMSLVIFKAFLRRTGNLMFNASEYKLEVMNMEM